MKTKLLFSGLSNYFTLCNCFSAIVVVGVVALVFIRPKPYSLGFDALF